MKIAIPTREDSVDNHFGQCNYFSIFEIEDGKIASKDKMESTLGCGCKSNLTQLLQTRGVTKMLAGNMGEGAVNKLTQAGIEVVRGCRGKVDDVMTSYLSGFLIDSGEICASHDHGHQCKH